MYTIGPINYGPPVNSAKDKVAARAVVSAVAACTDAVPFFQSLAERDAEVSKLRASATALEVELQRKTMDLGALQRQVCLHSGDDTL